MSSKWLGFATFLTFAASILSTAEELRVNNYQRMSRQLLGRYPQARRGSQAPYWFNQRPLLGDRWLLRVRGETRLKQADRRGS